MGKGDAEDERVGGFLCEEFGRFSWGFGIRNVGFFLRLDSRDNGGEVPAPSDFMYVRK